jgi:CheY-like chemotaxis protein
MEIVPAVGSISRLIIRNVVVLPQPLGPMSTTMDPSGTTRSSGRTAGDDAPGNVFVTPSSRMADADAETADSGVGAGVPMGHEPTGARYRGRVATTVLLADDDDRFRGLVRSVLEDDGYDVVGEAADADTAIRLAAELRPDIVVLDLVMQGADGLSTVRTMLAAEPGRALLVLSSLFDPLVEQEVAALGARYLDKTEGVEALEAAIDVAVGAAGSSTG